MMSLYLSALDTEDSRSLFEQWYIQYRQTMYAVAYGILHNREDSEDAVHQAFMNLAEHFEKARSIPETEIKAYIIIITRNTAINFYRKNKAEAEHVTVLEDDSKAVDIDFFAHIDYDALVKAISGLPEKYKDILFLRYLQEFSPKEVSDMLGISVASVRKRTERAKKLLQAALKGSEVIVS